MLQDGNTLRKWELRERNNIQIYLESESGICQEVSRSARACYKMEIYLESESEKKERKKVMIFKCIEKMRVKTK